MFNRSLRTTEMKGGRGNGAAAAADHCLADFQPSHPVRTGSALKSPFCLLRVNLAFRSENCPNRAAQGFSLSSLVALGPEISILWLQPGQAAPPAPPVCPAPLEMRDEGWHQARGARGAPQACASSVLPVRINHRTHEGSRSSARAPAQLQGRIP